MAQADTEGLLAEDVAEGGGEGREREGTTKSVKQRRKRLRRDCISTGSRCSSAQFIMLVVLLVASLLCPGVW